jgi:S-formylglutathione hydrolase FrmB
VLKKFAFVSVVLACLLAASFQPQSAKPLQAPKAAQTAQSTRVQTIQFESKLVGKVLPYNVLLPVAYDSANKNRKFPVLYLLHGLAGHYTNWLEKTQIFDYSAPDDLIIVTPEGNNGWYTDSATVPSDKYESYIIQELIPDVEKRFRAKSDRSGRAIAGLSMGGYGALKFGVKYPQYFALAGSMSGVLNAAVWTAADMKGLEFIYRTLEPVYGATDSETRAKNDLTKLYRALTPEQIAVWPFVYLDCGTEDPLININRDFARVLSEKKIPHEFRELPGGHSWTYWDAQVQEVLRIVAKKFTKQVV